LPDPDDASTGHLTETILLKNFAPHRSADP